MTTQPELQTFVTDLEDLFFEIGKLLALCKTANEQKKLLDEILTQIEASKEFSNPNESLEDDEIVVKEQLYRLYQKGFARWGLDQLEQKEKITVTTVTKEGGLLSYDEETKNREKSPIPYSLLLAFRKGWMCQKVAEKHLKETSTKKPRTP